ncbi:MAG: sulfotransferase [Pseudomonadota bacterium]
MARGDAFAFHIIGAGRGGTSLLAGLVDAHPRCEVQFERHSIGLLLGQSLRPCEELPDFEARVRARVARFIAACGDEAALRPDLLWGHKTTSEQINGLHRFGDIRVSGRAFDAIGHFVDQMAQTPTIFIIRDGRTCVSSKMRRARLSIEDAIRCWKFSIALLRRTQASAARLVVLKLEDLVTNPEQELRRVCVFLGVDYDPVMLQGTANTKMAPEYRRIGFSRHVTAPVDPDPPWLNQIAEELYYCGYAF